MRCYNAIELNEDTKETLRKRLLELNLTQELNVLGYKNQYFDVFLVSQWSETILKKFECRKVIGWFILRSFKLALIFHFSGAGKMTGIVIAIVILTAIIVLAVISAFFYVFK